MLSWKQLIQLHRDNSELYGHLWCIILWFHHKVYNQWSAPELPVIWPQNSQSIFYPASRLYSVLDYLDQMNTIVRNAGRHHLNPIVELTLNTQIQ